MDCSIVVISRNRPRHLERLFGYFAGERLEAPVLLGDASDAGMAETVAAICNRYGGRIDLRCTPYAANVPPVNRLRREFDKVETGAAMWVGDDDLVSLRYLHSGTERLASESECIAVVARAVTFSVLGDEAGGRISGIGDYLQKSYEHALASERLLAQAGDGVALTYSLRRTTAIQRGLADIEALAFPDDALGYYLFELLDGMLTVLAGKVALLDCIGMARQVHSGSTAAAGRRGAGRLDLLTRDDWPGAFARAQDLVARRLAEVQPGLGQGVAREIAETAFLLRLRLLIDKTLTRRLKGSLRTPLSRRAAAVLARLGRHWPGGELHRMMQTVVRFQTNT